MNSLKAEFIKNALVPLIKTLPTDKTSNWGKMNLQQMVEHLSLIFSASSSKINTPIITPEEHLPKYLEFLRSDKEFRENTKAPGGFIPEEPAPLKNATMDNALDELQKEIDDFFLYFSSHPGATTNHIAFGKLNEADWVQIHHKHVQHHLKQFGLSI